MSMNVPIELAFGTCIQIVLLPLKDGHHIGNDGIVKYNGSVEAEE